jgi:hypothetical protein
MLLPITNIVIDRPACFAPLPNDVIGLIFAYLNAQTINLRLSCRFFRKFNLHPFLTTISRQFLAVPEQIEATLPDQQRWIVVTSTFIIITGSEWSRRVPLPVRLDLNKDARIVKNCLFVLSKKIAYHLNLTTFVLRKISTKRDYLFSEPNSEGNIAYSDNGNQIFIKSDFSKSAQDADWLPQLRITQLTLLENNNLLISNQHDHGKQFSFLRFPNQSVVKTNSHFLENFFQHNNFLITLKYHSNLEILVSLDKDLEIISEISVPKLVGMHNLQMQKVGDDLYFLLTDRSIVRVRINEKGILRLLSHFRTNFNKNWFRIWHCHEKGIFILSCYEQRHQIEFWSLEGDLRGCMFLKGSVCPTSIAYNGAELLVGYADGTIKYWAHS